MNIYEAPRAEVVELLVEGPVFAGSNGEIKDDSDSGFDEGGNLWDI